MIGGVYEIVHNPTRRKYIGSSQDLKGRLSRHKVLLNAKKHHCVFLQNVWNKYIGASFSFNTLVIAEREFLFGLEQFYIDKVQKGFLMNSQPNAGGARGFSPSKSTREKLIKCWTPEKRAAHADRVKMDWTPERKAQQSAANKASWTPARRQKHREYMYEKVRTPGYKENMRELANTPERKHQRNAYWTPQRREKYRKRALVQHAEGSLGKNKKQTRSI